MTAVTLEMAQRGQLTIPKAFRDQYGLKEGQPMTILDIGGVFLMSPHPISVDAPADRLRDGLIAAGATLEDMLVALRERRETDGTL